MKIFLIYLTLFAFYVNEVMGGVGYKIKGLSLFNLNIYILMIVWAVDVLKRRRVFHPNNVNKYIVLMGIIVFVSIFVKMLHAEIPNISVKDEIIGFKNWLDPLLLFFILFNIIDDKKNCNRTLLGLCFLFAALILTQLSGTFGITDYGSANIARGGRTGGLGSAGVYAITLSLFLPFVVSGIFFMKRSRLFKIGCIILGFLTLVGLVNAGSRNGAVSSLLGILVYLFILKRKKRVGILPIIFLLLTMIMAGATAFIISPSYVQRSVSQRFDPSSDKGKDLRTYSSGRIAIWENGWKLFVDSPIFGHGRKTYSALSELRNYPAIASAHNEYIRHLVEYGLIGFIVFLLIFLKIFQNVWQSLAKTVNPWEKQIYISYIAGFCGYMVGLFATNFGPSVFIFWIYTAVIYKYAQLESEKGEENNPGVEHV